MKSVTTSAFLAWLKSEMLRLRSFDWGHGSWSVRDLKDGVASVSSFYTTDGLAKEFGTSEANLLKMIDSPSAVSALENDSFTAGWREGALSLSWLVEGVREWKTDISQDYVEKDGRYYVKFRWVDRIIYLDNEERVLRDSGEMEPAEISKEEFLAAHERIRRRSS